MAGLSHVVVPTKDPVQLDEIDRKIIDILRLDSRVSQRQLAREIGMSPPAVGERLSRLERLGVISGYTVEVDWGALGMPVLVYIPMTIAPGTMLSELLSELRKIPELEELTVLTGGYDLMARLRLRDHAHLQHVLLEKLWPIRGLLRVETFLSLGEVESAGLLANYLSSRQAEPG